MFRHNRRGVPSYLTVCAQIEHFLEYRQIVKEQIEEQLAVYQETLRQNEAEIPVKDSQISAIAS
jgi:hypothetical protein